MYVECSVVWCGPQHLCGGGVVAGTHCPGQAECDAALHCSALLHSRPVCRSLASRKCPKGDCNRCIVATHPKRRKYFYLFNKYFYILRRYNHM